MSAAATHLNITPTQRSTIRSLLVDRDLLALRVNAEHGDLFDRVGVSWREGQALDALLGGLSAAQAARLIVELTREDVE